MRQRFGKDSKLPILDSVRLGSDYAQKEVSSVDLITETLGSKCIPKPTEPIDGDVGRFLNVPEENVGQIKVCNAGIL